MKDFEQVLDECIQQMMSSASTLEECLLRYPAEAQALEPLLRAAAGLQRSRSLHPSAAYKAQARAELKRYIQAHPRRVLAPPRLSLVSRFAFSLTALFLALMVSGTAFAQGSLPGDSFYSWKITSERVWRAVSPDPVGIDLILAERRVQEYMSVSSDPMRSERALKGYSEVLARLKSETDRGSRGRIESVLQGHENSWKISGISIPELDEYLGEKTFSGEKNGNGAGASPQPAAPGQNPKPPHEVPTHRSSPNSHPPVTVP